MSRYDRQRWLPEASSGMPRAARHAIPGQARIRSMAIVLVVSVAVPLFAATEPFIHAEVIVEAPVDAVWNAWTTTEGVKSWFAPAANIEPKVNGAYEIFFAPNEPAGQRGADGMRILLFQPKHALAFTWNAPATYGERRNQLTHVIVRFHPVAEKRTRVTLTHSGFGLGSDWDAVRAYFDNAWSGVVLPRLQAKFAPRSPDPAPHGR